MAVLPNRSKNRQFYQRSLNCYCFQLGKGTQLGKIFLSLSVQTLFEFGSQTKEVATSLSAKSRKNGGRLAERADTSVLQGQVFDSIPIERHNLLGQAKRVSLVSAWMTCL